MNEMKEHFQELAKNKTSPIYAILSGFIAMQPEILQALCHIPFKKSPRTILFAAVHALLLKGVKHPLADFYPTIHGTKLLNSENRERLCAEFLDFFRKHQAELEPYLLRNTQTNEVKRSLALLPAFSEIVRQEKSSKLSLIEIGTSAGLLLNIDQYSYKLDHLHFGNVNKVPPFSCQWHGRLPKNLVKDFIHIQHKIGIDINLLNIEDEEVRIWLKALIWPEMVERLHNFDLAYEVFKQNKKNIKFFQGRFENYRKEILSICNNSKILCFMSVWVLYQFNEQERNKLDEEISEIARTTKAKVYFILDEWDMHTHLDTNNIFLREYDHSGHYKTIPICKTQHHGEWVDCYI